MKISLLRLWIAAALSLGSLEAATASQLTVSRSNLSDRLQQPTVTTMYRDSQGIFWVGTQQGLHRFDGVNHTVFNSDESNIHWIPDSDIRGITEDADGALFLATSSGLFIKPPGQGEGFELHTPLNKSAQERIVDIITTTNGETWALTKTGLHLITSRLGRAKLGISEEAINTTIGEPNTISTDGDGNIYIGGDLGVFIFNKDSGSNISFSLEHLALSNHSRVTAIEYSPAGKLIIGTNTGSLVVVDLAERKVSARANITESETNFVSDLLLHQNTLILATDRGLYSSNINLSHFSNLSQQGDDISNSNIYTLLEDGRHVWVGTVDGLSIMSFTSFDLLNTHNSNVYNDTLAFEQDTNGRIWVGTYSGLYSYDESTGSHTRLVSAPEARSFAEERVTSIYAKNNELWVGYIDEGIRVFDTDQGESVSITLGQSKKYSVTKIIGDINNNLWISTFRNGLYRISEEEQYSYLDNQKLPEKTITTLFLSRTNILIAVSHNRVYLHNSQTDSFEQVNFNFGSMNTDPAIYTISENLDGDILIGTKGRGVYVWSQKNQKSENFNLSPLGTDGSMNSSIVYGLETDQENNVWSSTQNGIVKLDPEGNLIKRFTTADGLQGNDFNFGASLTSREGLIYFGGVNGYNRFDPKEVEIDKSASPMRLTNVFFPGNDGRTLPDLSDIREVHLTHQDKSVTFQFSVLDFVHPEKNQFRYMLQNFDSNWVENGARNTATYTNLPSGRYVLRVQGANSAGIWNRSGITLDIYVSPPPWLTGWAICAYLILLLFLAWCGLRIYRSYVLARYAAEIEMEMIESDNRADDEFQEQVELQDEIIQSAYDHNIATLSLISRSISDQAKRSSAEIDLANSSIKRVKALTHLEDCFYFEDGQTVANLKKFGDLVISELLQTASVDPETIITINEISSRLIPGEIASPAAIVLYELMENCFLHAFDEGSPANYIHLKMEGIEDSDEFTFAVRFFVGDNGRGLPQDTDSLIGSSSGIGIAHAVVDRMGGTFELSEGTGCGITVTFPASEPI